MAQSKSRQFDPTVELVKVVNSFFEATTINSIRPQTVLACQEFGVTLAVSIDTCDTIVRTLCPTPRAPFIKELSTLVGYDEDYVVTALALSQAGVRFLGLASALVTVPLPAAAEALHDMLRSTTNDPEFIPEIEDLKRLLKHLEPRCCRSAFEAKIVEYEGVIGRAQFPSVSDTDLVAQNQDKAPSPKSLNILVDVFRRLRRIGDTESYGADINVGAYAAWFAAFTEWCLGVQPSILLKSEKKVRETILDHDDSFVRIIISRDADGSTIPLSATIVRKVGELEALASSREESQYRKVEDSGLSEMEVDTEDITEYSTLDEVELPQFVIVGDQSAGKSSIIDAIFGNTSGISIARVSFTHTRFATEYRLRRGDEYISIGVIPSKDRAVDDRNRLSRLKYRLLDRSRLGDLIHKFEDAILSRNGQAGQRNFAYRDIMTVEISGPTLPHLTLVDLPGFVTISREARFEKDTETINDIALGYMSTPRTIILAVLDGSSDFATQDVLHRTLACDKSRTRTLGIITKPDLMTDFGVNSVMRLVNNEDIRLDLGWHVVRNRTGADRNCETHIRNQIERDFFTQDKWGMLPTGTSGIESLLAKLSVLLPGGIKQYVSQPPDKGMDIEQNTASSVCGQSDIESIFSTGSLQSSISYVRESFPIAVSEWVRVLLDDEDLMLLFPTALSKVGPDRLPRNFARFLKNYSQSLKIEASNEAQHQAAQFARQSAQRAAIEITHVLTSDGINQWLESLVRDRTAQHLGDESNRELHLRTCVDGNELWSDTSSDVSESAELPSFRILEEVKEFMVSAEAFSILRHEFRHWLKLDKPEHPRTHKVTMWALGWLRLINIFSPPAAGYQRLPYTCGCGELLYLDVRELSPGGIERIGRRLRAAALRAQQQHTLNPTPPHPPPRAHTRPGRNVISGDGDAAEPQVRHCLPAQSSRDGSTEAAAALSQNPDPQFVLLCVNTKTSTALAHVEVGSLTSDQYLFQEIQKVYQKTREGHEWRLWMILPICLRISFKRMFKQLTCHRAFPGFFNSLSVLCRAISSVHLHRISYGDFVRFQLVPIGEDCCPTWFRAPEFPPESEVAARRYLYHPVPMDDVEIAEIPLPHLLKPGPHLDTFWINTFPKKLSEELRRPPGTGARVIGWGIRINERVNWSIALLGLLSILVMISVGVAVYSLVTTDTSSAFGFGAFLAALLTVYLTAQYFSWKEDL